MWEWGYLPAWQRQDKSSPFTTLAEWRDWSRGNPIVQDQYEAAKAQFRSLVLHLRYGQPPTRLGFMSLRSAGEDALRAHDLYHGDGEPHRRLRLQYEIGRALQAVDLRVRQAEALLDGTTTGAPGAPDNDNPPEQEDSKGKAGRKEVDDSVALADARKLIEEGMTKWAAAQSVATDRYPRDGDRDSRERLGRRVWKKLHKPPVR